MSAVVDKSVNSLLKHSLFVSHDDVRSIEFKHSFKTVVSVDNTSVEVVEVRCCVTSAVKHYHRTEIGRNNGNCVEYHPLRLIARKTECLDYLESLEDLDLLLTCGKSHEFSLEVVSYYFNIVAPVDIFKLRKLAAFFAVALCRLVKAGDTLSVKCDLAHFNKTSLVSVISCRIVLVEELFDSLSTHFSLEVVAVLFEVGVIFLLGEELLLHKLGIAGVCYDIFCEVENFFKSFL